MRTRSSVVVALGALALGASAALAQHQHGTPSTSGAATTSTAPPAPAGKKAPLRVTMEEMHNGHGAGVPRGWKFSWPDGDPQKGREVFSRLECYQCHQVPGAGFPEVKPDLSRQGPPLAGMGDMHPAEYFAESILTPNAVIVTGPGFTGGDGLSIMPDFRDSLTLAETIDLVAYLRSLTGGGHGAHHAPGTPAREQVTGDYRVRVAYAAPGAHAGHHAGAMSGHAQHGAQPGTAAGHLMVFVTDAGTGEAVPYLPLTATIAAGATPPRTIRLTPMVGDDGLHYGADVALPADVKTLTVTIGKPTIVVMGGRRTPSATSVTFEWSQ